MDAFTPKTWATGQAGGTPITAAELNRQEAGIESADDRLDALEPAVGRTLSHPLGLSRPGVYDPHRSLYLPDPPNAVLRPLRHAFGRAASGELVNLQCLGASNTAGVGPGVGQDRSWPYRLRALLAAAGIPSAGTGLVPTQCADPAARSARYTAITGWGGSALYSVNESTTAAMSFTSDSPGTVVEVWFLGVSAPFTVAIDGGAPVTVTADGSGHIRSHITTGLADTTHTVVINAAGAAVGTVGIVGVNVRRTSGLAIHNLGISGAMSSTWASEAFTQPSQIGLEAAQPDIVLINIGSNDVGNNVPLATYESNLDTILDLYSDVVRVLVIDSPRSGVPTFPQYVSAQYDRADALGIPIFDWSDRWIDAASALDLGLIGSDTLHASAAGHFDIARGLADALT